MNISGRIVSASGRGPNDAGARRRFHAYLGSFLNNDTPGGEGVWPYNYAAGHLIAASLGAPNTPLNFVPQRATFNGNEDSLNAAFYQMENWIRAGLSANPTVAATMSISPEYSDSSVALGRFVPGRFNISVNFGTSPSGHHHFDLFPSSTASSFTAQLPPGWTYL